MLRVSVTLNEKKVIHVINMQKLLTFNIRHLQTKKIITLTQSRDYYVTKIFHNVNYHKDCPKIAHILVKWFQGTKKLAKFLLPQKKLFMDNF